MFLKRISRPRCIAWFGRDVVNGLIASPHKKTARVDHRGGQTSASDDVFSMPRRPVRSVRERNNYPGNRGKHQRVGGQGESPRLEPTARVRHPDEERGCQHRQMVPSDDGVVEVHECKIPKGVPGDPGSRHPDVANFAVVVGRVDADAPHRMRDGEDEQKPGQHQKVVGEVTSEGVQGDGLQHIDRQHQEQHPRGPPRTAEGCEAEGGKPRCGDLEADKLDPREHAEPGVDTDLAQPHPIRDQGQRKHEEDAPRCPLACPTEKFLNQKQENGKDNQPNDKFQSNALQQRTTTINRRRPVKFIDI